MLPSKKPNLSKHLKFGGDTRQIINVFIGDSLILSIGSNLKYHKQYFIHTVWVTCATLGAKCITHINPRNMALSHATVTLEDIQR